MRLFKLLFPGNRATGVEYDGDIVLVHRLVWVFSVVNQLCQAAQATDIDFGIVDILRILQQKPNILILLFLIVGLYDIAE